MRWLRLLPVAATVWALGAVGTLAEEPEADSPVGAICDLIADNAAEAGMSPDFFARLIWKESRFDAGAISPVGARGIAQFLSLIHI